MFKQATSTPKSVNTLYYKLNFAVTYTVVWFWYRKTQHKVV